MASEELLRLAADFDPATADRWHELVDKVLRGRSFDDVLVAETYDGLAIQPLYGPADGPGTAVAGCAASGTAPRRCPAPRAGSPGTSASAMATPIRA